MTTVYPVFTHPATLCTVEDMIAYVFPKVERYVQRLYFDLSYDMQQDLIQEGLTTLWDEVRRGKLKPTDPQGHWVTTCKTGIMRAFEDVQLETGAYVVRRGERFIETRIVYECDLTIEGNTSSGLEIAEMGIRRNLGSCDPEGGKIDQHIDFDWLLTKAFSLLNTADVEDCAEIARHVADGKNTLGEFCRAHGWSYTRYYAAFDHLKDAFYSAVGKERPPKQRSETTVDAQKVIVLYKQGYGCDRIARLVGCSTSRVGQILLEFKKTQGEVARSTKRIYHYQPSIGASV